MAPPTRPRGSAPAPARGTPRLLLVADGSVSQVFPLRATAANPGVWTLGRRVGHAVPILEDPTVSRDHAVIRATPAGFGIADAPGCLNRTAVNGLALDPQEERPLRDGDVVEVGHTRLVFRAGPTSPA